MNLSPDNIAGHPIVPEKDRCVWMAAGILSYQLCDRQFDCDHCSLNDAMQMRFSHNGRHAGTIEDSNKRKDERIDEENALFDRNNCWVQPVENNILRIGIAPHFASILFAPKAVALPAIGETVHRGHACCWIVLEGGTIPILSPITGTVVAINNRLTEMPHEIHSHPFTAGWFFSVQGNAESLHMFDLQKKKEIESEHSRRLKHFNDALLEKIQGQNPAIGPTLQDGGQMLDNLCAMIGPKRYYELIRDAFLNTSP